MSSSVKASKIFRACVQCGVQESKDQKLVRCSRCYDENSIDILYCSTVCQKKDWKAKHKQWHNESTDRHEEFGRALSSVYGLNMDTMILKFANQLDDSDLSKYDKYITEGQILTLGSNGKGVKKSSSRQSS